MAVPNQRFLRWRQFFNPGILFEMIDGPGRFKDSRDFHFFEGVIGVGLVGPNKKGPAEVARFAGLIEFIEAQWEELFVDVLKTPAVVVSRAVFAPVEMAGSLVDGDSEGIATAHDVDFGAGFWSPDRKKISVWDGVAAIFSRTDPQDFPIQYRAVCRGACGVMKLGVVLVVSTTDEKISLWAEGKGSGFVDTILVAESGDFYDDLLGRFVEHSVFIAKS